MASEHPGSSAVAIYEKRADGVTAEDIRALVEEHQEETQFLDYIQQFDLALRDNGEQAKALVSELVAMSNHAYGMLIVGIAESGSRAVDILDVPEPQAVYDRVMQSFGLTVEPARPLPDHAVVTVSDNGTEKNVLVFTVVAPEEGIRLISSGNERYRCPIRVGTLPRRMSYNEMREKFQQDIPQTRLAYMERMLEHIVARLEGGGGHADDNVR